jgi:dTMP kinase
MNPPVSICVVGADGAGKTTQIKALADAAAARGLPVEHAGLWRVLEPDRHPECRFLKADRPQLRVCISEMEAPARALFLMWMHASSGSRSRAMAQDASLLLFDSYWYKHAAAELAMGAPEAMIMAVGQALPAPDLVVLLDVDPDTALHRKRAGGLTPYECGCDQDMRPQRFLEHQAAVRSRLLDWAQTQGWRVIDARQPAPLVSQAVIEALDHAGLG